MTTRVKAKREPWTPERFLRLAREVFNDKYSYELPDKIKSTTVITAYCKEHDLYFHPNPNDHFKKRTGCSGCKRDAISSAVKSGGVCASREVFIKAAQEVHGDKYDYSRVALGKVADNVEIICKIDGHGSFYPSPSNHIHGGTGCPTCGKEAAEGLRRKSQEDFIKDCKAVHGDRYDYSVTKYSTAQEKVDIICRRHGLFSQLAYSHVAGNGCAACAGTISTPELQIRDLLAEFGVEVVHGYRMECGLEIDLYCPSHGIGFEYDGLLWHSEDYKPSSYHLEKNRKALREGIRLIHIYEDDWVYNRDRTVHWILDKVGVHGEKTSARKCRVALVDWPMAKQFLDVHHIQGASAPGSVNLGLFTKSENVLVAVMCFVRREDSPSNVLLSRFCTSGSVVGGFSKLLKFFKSTSSTPGGKIYSFSDNGWSDGAIYSSNGFTLDAELPPDYYWIKGQTRYVKERFRRKNLPKILDVFNESKSEAENCRANGYKKLYDSGKKRWILEM